MTKIQKINRLFTAQCWKTSGVRRYLSSVSGVSFFELKWVARESSLRKIVFINVKSAFCGGESAWIICREKGMSTTRSANNIYRWHQSLEIIRIRQGLVTRMDYRESRVTAQSIFAWWLEAARGDRHQESVGNSGGCIGELAGIHGFTHCHSARAERAFLLAHYSLISLSNDKTGSDIGGDTTAARLEIFRRVIFSHACIVYNSLSGCFHLHSSITHSL